MKLLGLSGVALLAFCLNAPCTRAANVTWGPATNITGDSNVSTAGALVGAFNLGDVGVASTTVNGVTFAGLAMTGSSTTSGNFNLTSAPLPATGNNFVGGGSSTPYANLSSSYKTLLSSAAFVSGSQPTLTLTMSNLTVNGSYLFQFWSNLSIGEIDVLAFTTATAGNSVTVTANTGNGTGPGGEGGLGQFAIGTFTANAATQQIIFSGLDLVEVNGFQLRLLAAPGVPESGATLTLLAISLAGLALARRAILRHS